ncbi:SGNH/GDSL hydrolase family protein [Streptomyces diacarni]|uniref:SGNH/GDSL hydrolase family protein n=1 Tax=Streptomyces diacarni TaxID=2800381 RepID=A0A367FFQ1_9ACTN|nr:SGNH/GDSL hydrolase family protein [Streptomyces diacarni]RCG29216.1 SGNH/GDSL hydrolase family protein [Streptomyces diacarni]
MSASPSSFARTAPRRPSPARHPAVRRVRAALSAGVSLPVAAALVLAGAPTASSVGAHGKAGAHGEAGAHGKAEAVARYVALGDSYTSGPGIPEQTDENCGRSDHNYPTLVTAALAPGTFADASCGGATTAEMTAPQGTAPPQFDALNESTDLVTVGIGGNDIGFGGIVARCVLLGALVPNGAPCKASYSLGGSDELAARIEATATKIDEVLRGIQDRSPGARVLVVGYPALLPEDGSNCPRTVSLASGDAPWLRDTEKRLNSMLAERAEASGAEYVDTYTGSVGHDLCKPVGTRWAEPLQAVDAAGFHPNAAGHQAMSQAVLAAVRR